MNAKAARKAKLAELQRSRAGAKRDYTAEEDTSLYDEVNEEDYKVVVKGRLQQDDFIEDDGVAGYADNGMDDWDERDRVDDEDDDEVEEEARRKKAKAAKLKVTKAQKKESVNTAALAARVNNPATNPYIKASAPVGDIDDFMNNLLGELDTTVEEEEEQRPLPSFTPMKRKVEDRSSSIGAATSIDNLINNVGGSGSNYGASTSTSSLGKKVKVESKVEREMDVDLENEEEDDEILKAEEIDEDDVFVRPALPTTSTGATSTSKKPIRRSFVNGAATKSTLSTPAAADSLSSSLSSAPLTPALGNPTPASGKSKGMDWRTATAALPYTPLQDSNESKEEAEEEDPLPAPDFIANARKGPAKREPTKFADVMEADGTTLHFWWYDMIEANGVVSLIGKAQEKSGAKRWVSTMVVVKGIRRKLYILPRPKMLDDDLNPLDDVPDVDDVMTDFEYVADERFRIDTSSFKFNPEFVKKKYAFAIKDIPRGESDWVELTYDFSQPQIDSGFTSGTFSHVLGTNTSAFERFSVERKIMGPGWLRVENCVRSTAANSFCKMEVDVDVESVFDDAGSNKLAPPLTIISLAIRTVVHVVTNTSEIVCATARVWKDSNLDDTRPLVEQPSSVTTMVRNLFTPFPNGFEQAAKAAKSKILPLKDEKGLLDYLLALFTRYDPDVIVGNDLNADLSIVIKRIQELKCNAWSRLSHFQRLKPPTASPRDKVNVMTAGRLRCDLANCRDIISSVTWSLSEICESHLNIEREDIDPEDVAGFFDDVRSTASRLVDFVQHCEADAYFQMAVLHKVQALLLTRTLSNLAGVGWGRTLLGTNRAERNDSMLVHRFTEKGYICPDKFTRRETEIKKDLAAKKTKKLTAAMRKKAKEDAAAEGDDDAEGAGVVVGGEEEEEEGVGGKKVIVGSKAKFAGGLVFEPTKGLYDTIVVVMDFNSLYPSIIQEYDIDFMTMDWTAEGADDPDKMPDIMPCVGEATGILPTVIAILVGRRKAVKALMSDKSLSEARRIQLDITQLALKLTANSMYGCLGFEGGRFYAKPLAAITTFKGRAILTSTKADAEGLGLAVIYGDTDSVMIDTRVTDYDVAIKIANEFKKVINAKYRKLEIDTDAVFSRMLLQQKKKYAALKYEKGGKLVREVKGLDQKRREFSLIAKEVLSVVLDKILLGDSTEAVIEEIHEYLTAIGNKIRAGEVPRKDFIINARLGKEVAAYGNSPLPQIAVAKRMLSKGLIVKQHDNIPYIVCLKEDGTSGGKANKENSFHPDELRKTGSTLVIDFESYLAHQLLPPLERLCANIEGTDRSLLSAQLGLDPAKYKSKGISKAEETKHLNPLQSQIPDSVRFADCDTLKIRCRVCGTEVEFDSLPDNAAGLLNSTGMYCSNFDCAEPLNTASLVVQLELQIRAYVTRFYRGWLVCDDQACENRTRMMSVYGKRCLATPCRGQMRPEYSDNQLYNQILFFDGLFNVEKIKANLAGTARGEELAATLESNTVAFKALKAVTAKYLDKNGRRWVTMKSLFSFMSVKS